MLVNRIMTGAKGKTLIEVSGYPILRIRGNFDSTQGNPIFSGDVCLDSDQRYFFNAYYYDIMRYFYIDNLGKPATSAVMYNNLYYTGSGAFGLSGGTTYQFQVDADSQYLWRLGGGIIPGQSVKVQ